MNQVDVWGHSLKQRDSRCKLLGGGTQMDASGTDLGESSCRDEVGAKASWVPERAEQKLEVRMDRL